MILIPKTKTAPEVCFDDVCNKLIIQGSSYDEDPIEAYRPVFEWLDNYLVNVSDTLTCEFYFDLLNSSSHKVIYDFLFKLQDYFRQCKVIKIIWRYDDYDEDTEEKGAELSELLEMPFEFVTNS